jgi:xanthine dehydrogenase accessory factor
MRMMLAVQARQWLQSGTQAVVVEIAATQGSTPRATGTRMLVSGNACAGTIGGGHLEQVAIELARQALEDPQQRAGTLRRRFSLGPSLGQCCGGALELTFRRLDASMVHHWPQPEPLFHLMLFGAGHVGRALVQALAPLGCTVDWIDEREAQFDLHAVDGVLGAAPAAMAQVRPLAVDAPVGEVAQGRAGSFYLIMTHSHDLDLQLCEAVLARDDFGFLGVIGSATKRARFQRRLSERGFAAHQSAKLHCPVGIAGIQGKEPQVIAASVVAQLLLVRSQRLGRADSSQSSNPSCRAPIPLTEAS